MRFKSYFCLFFLFLFQFCMTNLITQKLFGRIFAYFSFNCMNLLQEILKYVSKSVKESVLVFNGEMRNSKELIKNIKEKLNKQIPQNVSHTESTTQILADLYAPCVSYQCYTYT